MFRFSDSDCIREPLRNDGAYVLMYICFGRQIGDCERAVGILIKVLLYP